MIPCREHLICDNGICAEGECWQGIEGKPRKNCEEPGKKCSNKRCLIECSELHSSCPKVSVKSIWEVICFSGPNSCSHLCYKFWSKKLKDFAWFKKNNSLTNILQIHTLLDKYYYKFLRNMRPKIFLPKNCGNSTIQYNSSCPNAYVF